jgi:septum site-determining protein MinD
MNVVSGKGGTGKSLLCAVLGRLLAQEGKRVLLVDMDVFVRGLTYFFYLYTGERRKLARGKTISDFLGLVNRNIPSASKNGSHIDFERFYEVDILPAVSEIEEQVDYLKIETGLVKKSRELLRLLRAQDYDFVILDNRSGVDQLILETCSNCDLSIAVSESDSIARATNNNLLRHLSGVGKVYTIINKVPGFEKLEDYEAAMQEIRHDFTILGQIPFDGDIFEKFGTPRFWNTLSDTRFTYALAEAWNKLSGRERYEASIGMERFSRRLWTFGPSFMSRFERLSFLMGIAMILFYFAYEVFRTRPLSPADLILIYAAVFLAFPIIRRFLKAQSD